MADELEQLQERMRGRGLRACPICAGRHFFVGRLGYEHATGSSTHWFDLVICARCGRTDTFVDREPREWVAHRAGSHAFLEYQLPDGGPASAG